MYFHGHESYHYQPQYNSSATLNQRLAQLDDLREKLAQKTIFVGSTVLLKAVDNETFLNLWKDLWNENADIKRQGDYLEIIVAAVSERHLQIRFLTQNFVAKLINSGLVERIVSKQIISTSHNLFLQTEPYAKILHNLVKILIAGFELAPNQIGDIFMLSVEHVLTKMMNASFVFREIKLSLEQLQKIVENFREAKEEQGQQNTEQNQRVLTSIVPSQGKPTDDFRTLPIIPLAEELASDYEPFVRKAIIKGRYESDNEYLDIQFRLMREDLVQKFREGIATHETYNNDIYVHRDVRLDPPTLHYHSGENIYYTNIKISKQILNNKTMKYQSLLCVSSDDFQKDFLFATVIDRDDIRLKDRKIGLKFEGNKFEIDVNKEYSMVESSAFFEAYRPVLTTLQNFNPEKPIPFSRYLVQLNTKTELPLYLKYRNDFDFSTVLTKKAKSELNSTSFHPDKLSEYNCEHFGMNESQFEAFKHALISDLAVIQGPPGTGKSYIGAEIAKFLLNDHNWITVNPDENDPRPLLVVCYTNHALDQFLTQIAGFVDGNYIVRVGSKCKNPTIRKFMLHNKRPEMNEDRTKYYSLKNETEALLDVISKNLEYLIELENRVASKDALCASENFNRIANNVLFTTLSTDEDIVQWLTTHKRNDNEYPYDVKVIRQLVDWDIKEILAKNMYAEECKKNNVIDVAKMFHNSKKAKTLPSHLENENSKNWPKLAHIDELIELGYPEELAIEMLASVKNNISYIREEHNSMTTEHEKSYDAEIYKDKLKLIGNYLITKNKYHDLQISECDDTIQQQEKEEKQEIKCWRIPTKLEPYCDFILRASPMKDTDAYSENDKWKLSLLSRWSLYQFWINEAQKSRKKEIAFAEGKYRDNKRLLNELKIIVDHEILKTSKIIGMTTTGAAKYQSTLKSIKPRIVIVEEAAEVFEAHIVTSLTDACEHLILIGDHKQLRPNPAVYLFAKKFNLDISMFERLIKNGFPYKMLTYQRRMRPEISKLMKQHFYPNLLDHETVKHYPHVKGVVKDLFFITHTRNETSNTQDGSHKNEYEIFYALKLANYFLHQGYETNQITILCTYSDQCSAMEQEKEKILGEKKEINIETVDNFQGEESDIVILSLVRSNNNDHKIGFLKISNRKCVALSRAKMGLYIIGNMDFIATAEKTNNAYVKRNQSWEDIVRSAKADECFSDTLTVKCQMHGKISKINSYEDFDTMCIEGGCQLKCNRQMQCGHTCVRYCHGDDMDHIITPCHQPCIKKCPSDDKHPCMKECWEECGPCEVEVEKILECEHTVIDHCHVKIESITCLKPCNRWLECDHRCPKKCNEKCPSFCKELIDAKLVCGHKNKKRCSEDPLTVKCMTPIEKEWPICKHKVTTLCYMDPEVDPCPHPCNTILEDCGHKCQGTCGSCNQGLLHKICEQKCGKNLFCGHKCEAKCFEACPPCKQPCQTGCSHNSRCSSVNSNGKKQVRDRFSNSDNDEKYRKCGEACIPCLNSTCVVGCQHSSCTMKCGQECNNVLCTKPCGKPLRCRERSKDKKIIKIHPCVGVCGENKCLTLCPICDIDKLKKIMKDSPLNNDEKEFSFVDGKVSHAFIELENCHHIFEVTALDNYIKSSLRYPNDKPVGIEKLKCPKCGKAIYNSRRYNGYINKQEAELENIKQILREFEEDKNKQEQFSHASSDLTTLLNNITLSDLDHLSALKNSLSLSPSNVTPTWLLAAENCQQILSTLAFYASEVDNADFFCLTNGCIIVLEEYHITDCRQYLKQKFNDIFERCSHIPISNDLYEQLSAETKRFGFFVNLFLYLIQFSCDSDNEEEIDRDTLKSIVKGLTDNVKFTNDNEVWELFDTLIHQHGIPYEAIRTTQINLKKVPQKNRWFKIRDSYYCE